MERFEIPLGGRLITVTARRHARARRITLRLSAAKDAIILTLPRRAALAAGMRFLRSKQDWALKNVEERPRRTLNDGESLCVFGQELRIRRQEGRGVSRIAEGEIRVHGKPEFTARRVRDFLKAHLKRECEALARTGAQTLGTDVAGVRIRDARSLWGSCSPKGVLTFNWRLALAPRPVLEYLVAHETAHRLEMNHGERFWQAVARLYPDYAAARRWLKRHGHTLHSYE